MIALLSAHLCADYVHLGQWDKAYEQAQLAIQTKDHAWYYAGFNYWAVIEALLQKGDGTTAERDIAAFAEAVERFPRYKLVVERGRAALMKWQGDVAGAVAHLETALQHAEALSLPGEQWPLLVELGELHDRAGRERSARSAFMRAAKIVRSLAATIDDQELRDGFLSAEPVQSLFEAKTIVRADNQQ